jgi:hypothetical protein
MTSGEVTSNVPNPINGILFKLVVKSITEATSIPEDEIRNLLLGISDKYKFNYDNIIL